MKEYFEKQFDIIAKAPNDKEFGALFTKSKGKFALKFHKSLPGYKKTPLVELKNASKKYNVKSILIKDESKRFGLKSFKCLGGSYAIFRIMCEKFNVDYKSVDYNYFLKPEIKEKCSKIEFVTATDGNHGKGISWASKLFNTKSHVIMPKGTVPKRKETIEKAGSADVQITDMNYDKSVNYASYLAKENGWILVQDTSLKNYTKYPKWIIEGYLTMAMEISEQLKGKIPTHVFLQAGVGAMAGGIVDYLKNEYGSEIIITLVEPKGANCVYESVKKGQICTIEGNPKTIMAGLNCGTPCCITFPILNNCSSCFVSCNDDVSKIGMRAYANPLNNDKKIVSGESGGVTYGLLIKILENENLRSLFKINDKSTILLINTEGDTDPDGYRAVINSKQ